MKTRKLIMAVIAAVLAVAMLSGCGGGGSTAGENEDVLKLEGTLASAEPLDLTIFLHFWDTQIFDDDWPIFKEAAKRTNITLHGTASKATTDSGQAFNTMLVNDVLPDIIHGTANDLNKAGRDGALIPLQDLVKKYAPHIQAKFDEYPDAYANTISADGNLYYIPLIRDPNGPSMGWFIRQDWLDNLNLPVPSTFEEYYNTLKAFRDQDPNGNGIKDEVPYFDRQKGIGKLIGLWGESNTAYPVDQETGKVYASAVTDNYKAAMKGIAQWYAERLIDQEIFTRKNAREELFGNNVGGATNDWFSSTMSFNDVEKGKIDGFNLVSIPPMKDINGSQKYTVFGRSTTANLGWGISKDNKYIAETMKFFDFWFTEEGSLLASMGIEGTHWTMVDGEPQYTELVTSYEGGGAPNYMRTIGSCEYAYFCKLEPEVKGMNEGAAKAFQNYIDNGWSGYQQKIAANVSLTDDELRIIQEKGTAIATFVSEQQQNWILGNSDVDATWDKYIADLESLGLSEVVAAYQTAVDRAFGQK